MQKTFTNTVTLENIFWNRSRGMASNLFFLEDRGIKYIVSFTYNENLSQCPLRRGLDTVATCPCCILPEERGRISSLAARVGGPIRWISGDLHKLKDLPEFQGQEDLFTDKGELRLTDDAWSVILEEVLPMFI